MISDLNKKQTILNENLGLVGFTVKHILNTISNTNKVSNNPRF